MFRGKQLMIYCCLLLMLYKVWSEEYHLFMKEFECKSHDPEGIIKYLNCSGSKTGNDTSFNFKYVFEYNKDVFAYKLNTALGLQKKNKKRKKSTTMVYNFTNLDGCELLRNRNLPMLFNTKEAWHMFGKLPKSCPIRKNNLYSLEGFALHANILRFVLKDPLLFWFDIIVNNNKIVQASGQIRVQKVENPIHNNKNKDKN